MRIFAFENNYWKQIAMKRKILIYSLLMPFAFVLFSCGKDDPDVIAEKDKKKIQEYIAEHELEGRWLDEGVYIVITKEGVGGTPAENSLVLVNYIGYLLNGDAFDNRNNQQISLSNVVRGFRIGVMELNRGSRATIIMPSAAGYGQFAQSGIPMNSVLLFDVELIDF